MINHNVEEFYFHLNIYQQCNENLFNLCNKGKLIMLKIQLNKSELNNNIKQT